MEKTTTSKWKVARLADGVYCLVRTVMISEIKFDYSEKRWSSRQKAQSVADYMNHHRNAK